MDYISNNKQKTLYYLLIFFALCIPLGWNFFTNSLQANHLLDYDFQTDSEALVAERIEANFDGLGTDKYGLGKYHTIENSLIDIAVSDTSNLIIRFDKNKYTDLLVSECKYAAINGGKELEIADIAKTPEEYNIILDVPDNTEGSGDRIDFSDITFYDKNHTAVSPGMAFPYTSQYGLQGKIFTAISSFFPSYGEYILHILHFLCCAAAAAIFTAIVMLLCKKYNLLMAVCFYITFLLSPWIVSFSRNLYWVVFTWFLPMLIGLVCSIWGDRLRVRLCCYLGAFVSILIKCLCGYEYISTIMMAMISFLTADLVIAVLEKNKKKQTLVFKSIFIIGVLALLAFAAAICIHAAIRGDGNIITGIKDIYERDVIRRTYGGYNVSVFAVLARYMIFTSSIISGIPGPLFPVFIITALLIIIFDIRNKNADRPAAIMYAFFFTAAISWFILAKSHSYAHTHINYVLWYFGFIQICMYIVLKKACTILKKHRVKSTDKREAV